MFKNKFALLLVLSSSLFTSSSFAADTVVLCNYCSDSSMKSKAISYAPNGGIVHVVDYKGKKIKAFETEREEDLLMVYASSVESAVETGVAQLRGSVNTILDLANGGVDIVHLQPYLGGYPIESAHTVATNNDQKSALSQALSDYFTSNVVGGLTAAISSLGQGIVNQVIPINLAVDVIFTKDGSTYTFVFKGILKNLNGDISLIIDPVISSGDDEGVRLAESYNQGYFASGSTAALQRVVDYMIESGVSVTYGGAGSTTITDITCSNEPPHGCVVTK